MTTLALLRFASPAALEEALAERLGRALAASGASAVMLAGGSTPLPVYAALARRPPAHDPRLHVLFSDERYVPADAEESNYRRCRPLLDALALEPASVLRVRTELPLAAAADDYERQLTDLSESGVRIGLGLLGLGADGHTASLFAASDLERARGRLAVTVRRPDGLAAVSVTPGLLARVAEPLFVVVAGTKLDAVHALIAHDPNLIAWAAVQGCPRAELWYA